MKPQLSHIISRIYDTIIDDAVWQEVLQELIEICGANSGVIQYVNYDTLDFRVLAASDCFVEMYQHPDVEGWVGRDVWAQLCHENMNGHAVVLGSELLRTSEFRKTDVYGIWRSFGYNSDEVMTSLYWHNSVIMGYSALYFESRRRPVTSQQKDTLRLLHRHLKKALGIKQQFSMPDVARKSLEAALSLLPDGVIFLDKSQRILHMNQQAKELLQASSQIEVNNNRLRFASASIQSQYKKLLFGSIQESHQSDLNESGAFRLYDPAEGLISFLIMPFPHDKIDSMGTSLQLTTHMLLVSRVDPKIKALVKVLGGIAGLTGAEQQVVQALAHGQKLQDYALRNGLSIHTVRTQLKQVFQKTGTDSQISLMNKVFTLLG